MRVKKSKFDRLYEAIKNRFPGAQFVISCFKNVEEIENKVLCDDELIIYCDTYIGLINRPYQDQFIIRRRPGEDHIYYKDVIDQIIEYGFVRNDCNHKFMENIRLIDDPCRNENSLPRYNSYWGS